MDWKAPSQLNERPSHRTEPVCLLRMGEKRVVDSTKNELIASDSSLVPGPFCQSAPSVTFAHRETCSYCAAHENLFVEEDARQKEACMNQRIRQLWQKHPAWRLTIVAGSVLLILALAIGAVKIVMPAPTFSPSPHPPPLPHVSVSPAQTAIATPTGSPQGQMIPVQVSAYALEGRMADGKWVHVGACAVSQRQFPLGTILALYNRDGSFNRRCLAEDTGTGIGSGQIDVAMPGDAAGATRWGKRQMWVCVVRWGWGAAGSEVCLGGRHCFTTQASREQEQ
jgi:3D (Asp-Asp-Asp) domain-containing protein